MATHVDPSSPPLPLRCAVYSRTSREGETDPAFTSINAQQEACYAYIASRHHLSWLPVSVSYPGFNMLQKTFILINWLRHKKISNGTTVSQFTFQPINFRVPPGAELMPSTR